MQLYFIRHGESENNWAYYAYGSTNFRKADPALTERGRRQAEALAAFLKPSDPLPTRGRDGQNLAGFGITHLYSSLMLRAVQTGASVARALGLPLVAWPDLHEVGGLYLDDEETGACVGQPGKNRAYFEANVPELVLPESLGEAGWWNRPAEKSEEAHVRAERLYRELMSRHGGTRDKVALVSHGEFYVVLLRTLFSIGRGDSWFSLNNAAITRIDLSPPPATLVYQNRLDYMPRELVT